MWCQGLLQTGLGGTHILEVIGLSLEWWSGSGASMRVLPRVKCLSWFSENRGYASNWTFHSVGWVYGLKITTLWCWGGQHNFHTKISSKMANWKKRVMPLYYTYPSTVLKSDQNHKARHMFQRKTKTFKTIQKITKRNKNCLYYTHRHTRTHVHM